MLTQAPPLEASKKQESSYFFEALPKSGSLLCTLVGANYLPEYVSPFDEDKVAKKALELFFAYVDGNGNYHFVKSYPKTYSDNEKSWYSAMVKAMTGELPVAGSNVQHYMGKSCMLDIENAKKTSKKGDDYTKSIIRGMPTGIPDIVPKESIPDGDKAIEAFNGKIAEIEKAREEWKANRDTGGFSEEAEGEQPPF